MIEGFFRKIVEFFGIKKKPVESNSGFDHKLQRLEKESDDIVLPHILDISIENDIIEKDIRVLNNEIVEYYLDKLFENINDCEYSTTNEYNCSFFSISSRKLKVCVTYNGSIHNRSFLNIVLNILDSERNKRIEIPITDDEHLNKFKCFLLACQKIHKVKTKNKGFVEQLKDLESLYNKIQNKIL